MPVETPSLGLHRHNWLEAHVLRLDVEALLQSSLFWICVALGAIPGHDNYVSKPGMMVQVSRPAQEG
jgi:hypothetical protein